jgi:hypothetical protein
MQEAGRGAAAPSGLDPKLIAKLNLPPLSLAQLHCGCANVRQLRLWLQGLNLQTHLPQNQNQHRLTGLLRSLFAEISQWQAPAARRLAMLEFLRELTLNCAESLALQNLAMARTQTTELRRALLIAVILLQHLAQSYASVALQLSQRKSLFRRARLAISAQRALDSYRRLIHICSLFYLATPKGSWNTMQALLRLAQLENIGDRRVADAKSDAGKCSATGTYLHIALFAGANPQQWDSREMQRLWQQARQWAGRASISGEPLTTASDSVLLASLGLDQPPIPAARLSNCKVDPRHFCTPRGWKIELARPLKQLQKQLRKSPDPLLEKIRALWAGGVHRIQRRSAVNLPCQVVFGISAVCHQLGTARNPHLAASGASFRPLADRRRQHLVMEVDTVDFGSGKTLSDYEVALPSARHADDRRPREQRYQPVAAEILDTSAAGAGLKLPIDAAIKLRVGELIGLGIDGHWQLAVIRWQYALPDHCRCGVELLPGELEPVQVRRLTLGGRASDLIAGLRLHGERENAALILPVPLFKRYDSADVIGAEGTDSVTLHQQTLTTGSIACFEFC